MTYGNSENWCIDGREIGWLRSKVVRSSFLGLSTAHNSGYEGRRHIFRGQEGLREHGGWFDSSAKITQATHVSANSAVSVVIYEICNG